MSCRREAHGPRGGRPAESGHTFSRRRPSTATRESRIQPPRVHIDANPREHPLGNRPSARTAATRKLSSLPSGSPWMLAPQRALAETPAPKRLPAWAPASRRARTLETFLWASKNLSCWVVTRRRLPSVASPPRSRCTWQRAEAGRPQSSRRPSATSREEDRSPVLFQAMGSPLACNSPETWLNAVPSSRRTVAGPPIA